MKEKALFIILMLASVISVHAQNSMRVALKDGSCVDIPIEQIDSVTFVTTEDNAPQDVSLVGTWYWES